MIRELDQSRITLRLIDQADRDGRGSDEHVVAKLSGSTLQILQRALVRHRHDLRILGTALLTLYSTRQLSSLFEITLAVRARLPSAYSISLSR
jgi:hypothetical protein